MDEEAVFLEALQKTAPQARAAFLDDACAGDPSLREGVELLLQAHEKAGEFLQGKPPGLSPTVDQPITEKPGTAIGRYKLLEQIGEGGFGVVFMAEQQEPVRRKLALKIIKPGMDTKEVIARFEAERQALAIMDHPNIAKVLDAGATESGRPFFVMELVRGISITDFCDQNSLTTRERLELFASVCQAVQHAHQKGIIHRDIKPSNVLVTMHDDKPVPKVIDFGVAKATNQQLTERTFFTRFAQMIGTPLYMSPEQAQMSGLDVDTRSDIYSLGVLLYELLTGTTPFDQKRIREAAYDELLRIIREEEPPRPSLRISTLGETLPSVAAHRKLEPKKLSALVRGELDWIVMKALEKDRVCRYETANGFAADIERYLSDEPVEACPPSAAYRFTKFARRNKVVMTTVGLIAGALLLGTIVSTWQAIRASKAENLAAQLTDHLADALGEAKDNLDLATGEQQRAAGNLDLALDALDAVYLDAIGEKKLLGEPLASRNAEGSAFEIERTDLSDFEKELLRRGLAFYDQFARRNRNTSRAAAQTARAYYRVAMLQGALNGREQAEEGFRESIHRFKALILNEPDNHLLRHELAKAYFGLAMLQANGDDARRSLSIAEETINAAIELKADAAEYYKCRADIRLGLGDYRRAQQDSKKATDIAPENIEFHIAAIKHYGVSAPPQYKDIRQAILHCQRALELEPDNAALHEEFGHVLVYVDLKRALAHVSRAIELDPTRPRAFGTRARIYMAERDYERALSDINEAIRLNPKDGSWFPPHLRRAQIYNATEQFEKARADLLLAEQRLRPGHPVYANLLEHRGRMHLGLRDYASAENDYSRGIALRPLLPFLYEQRSIPRFHLEKYDESLKDIKTSCELWPGNGFPLFRIPSRLVATCPDEDYREGLLALAKDVMKECRRPNDWSMYADLLTACGRYDDAEIAYERTLDLELHDNLSLHLYRFALLQAWRGNGDGARRTCGNLLDRFAGTADPTIAHFAAWTCSLMPEAVGNYQGSLALAATATGAQPENNQFLNTQGAVLHRAGRHQEALDKLTELNRRMNEPNAKANSSPAYTWYFLAMAHHALGQAEDARRWLKQANQAAEKELAEKDDPPPWNRRFTLELLRTEANGLIDDEEPQNGPERADTSEPPPSPRRGNAAEAATDDND
ncbi:MAG TPA: protein kinase [Pirellulaceae bacterium]|nr:protein kinase [Pirellulaceae bacterium]